MIIIIPTIKYSFTYYNTFTMGVCSNYHGFFFSVVGEGALLWATPCLGPSLFFLNEKKINIFPLMQKQTPFIKGGKNLLFSVHRDANVRPKAGAFYM